MVLIVIGVILLLFTSAGISFIYHARKDLRAVRRADAVSARELQALFASQRGEFPKYCQLDVVAQAPGSGAFSTESAGHGLTSYLARESCVWFQYRVVRHYVVKMHSATGPVYKKRQEIVFDYVSPEHVVGRDDAGGLLQLSLTGLDADQPEGVRRTYRHREDYSDPAYGGSAQQLPTVAYGITVDPQQFSAGRTEAFEFLEWVIGAGDRLCLVGEVVAGAEGPVFGASKRRTIVSSRNREQLVAHRARESKSHGIAVAVTAGLGAALVLLGTFWG